eukprot:3698785-Amphidinium_carterae.1
MSGMSCVSDPTARGARHVSACCCAYAFGPEVDEQTSAHRYSIPHTHRHTHTHTHTCPCAVVCHRSVDRPATARVRGQEQSASDMHRTVFWSILSCREFAQAGT